MQAGERLGLNGIFLSERWDTKELGAVMGALTQATERVQLVAGMTHFGTRHPPGAGGHGRATPPPIVLGPIGPKTLALGGTHFDGVVLHPFLTTAGVARSIRLVCTAAAHAGRDAAAVTLYATIVMVPDSLSVAQRADMLEARSVLLYAS